MIGVGWWFLVQTASAAAHDASWLALSIPPSVRAWVAVDDAAEALRWQETRGATSASNLAEAFGLRPQALADLHRPVVRCEMAFGDESSEFLMVRGRSEDDAAAIAGSAFDKNVAAYVGDVALAATRPQVLASAIQAWRDLPESAETSPLMAEMESDLEHFVHDPRLRTSWYVQPRRFWERNEADADFARRHGLDSLSAIAGVAALSGEGLQGAVARIAVDRPLQSSAAMMQLKPTKALVLPEWLNRAQRGGAFVSADAEGAFQHLAAFFDDAFAEGIEGTYREVLDDIRNPEGLGLDLHRELYAYFGDRVFLGTPSGDWDSGQRLIGIEIREGSDNKVGDAVRRMMEDDPEVERRSVSGEENPLWLYPTEGPTRGGVIATRGWLLICHDESMLLQTLGGDGASDERQSQVLEFHPPAALDSHAADFAGVFLADSSASQDAPSRLLDPFFRGFATTPEEQSTARFAQFVEDGFFSATYSGWCYFDRHGWLLVTCAPQTFAEAGAPDANR